MNPTEKSLEIIKKFEGISLTSYFDSNGIPTIGWGTTIYLDVPGSPKVKMGESITAARADLLLSIAIKEFSKQIDYVIYVQLTQNQFDALVSFVYNIGIGDFKNSEVLKLINSGDLDSVPDELLKWDHAAGKVSIGLLRRRHLEADLFGS
jgi:lysozyme